MVASTSVADALPGTPPLPPTGCISFPAPLNDCITLGTSQSYAESSDDRPPQAVAPASPVPSGQVAPMSYLEDCPKMRYENQGSESARWFRNRGFISHAADGFMNIGRADARSSVESPETIVLTADATSGGGNDATSWAHGSTGFSINLLPSTDSTQSYTVNIRLAFEVHGLGTATTGRVSGGNLFGVEYGGTASSIGSVIATGYTNTDYLAPDGGDVTEGPTPLHSVVIDDDTEADAANTEIVGGELQVDRTFVMDLPSVFVPAGQSVATYASVRTYLNAKGITGGLGSAMARSALEFDDSRSGFVKAKWAEITSSIGWVPDVHCL